MVKKKIVKFKLGDVVQLNKFWNNKIGFVQADDTAWYVIKGHWSIANCICKSTDVIKVIQPNVIPKKYLKYL